MPLSILIIGGSDAGISAALRAHELDASARIATVLADAFPNFSSSVGDLNPPLGFYFLLFSMSCAREFPSG
jgi:hypothetical protein